MTASPSTIPIAAGQVALIVSDAHLHPRHPERQERLLRVLNRYEGRMSALICLGDLFDFWFGYESVVPRYAVATLAALERITQTVPFWYFTGNHDFALGPYFSENVPTTVFTEPTLLRFGETLVAAGHGDEFDRNLGNRALRWLLHQPGFQRFAAKRHPDWVWRIAHGASHASKSRREGGHAPPPRMAYEQDRCLRRAVEQGATVALSGHLHTPFVREFLWQGKRLVHINNGDLVENATYTTYTPEEGFRLRSDGGRPAGRPYR